MAQINSYLTFNGNCREAMSFYQQCLGGKLIFQSIGESPLAERMPSKVKDYILQATLTNEVAAIMGSDMAPPEGLTQGNTVSLMVNCNSEEEIRNCYIKLAEGGTADYPLEETFWGALFGGLTDKYGNRWLLNYTRS